MSAAILRDDFCQLLVAWAISSNTDLISGSEASAAQRRASSARARQ
jgi:hypothetical protein